MNEYIDKAALVESFTETIKSAETWRDDCKNLGVTAEFAERAIIDFNESRLRVQNFPTVDAVEKVIRCKDCKYRDPEDKSCGCGHDIIWQLPRDDNWFCADGKRMADDPSHPFADDVMMGERITDE